MGASKSLEVARGKRYRPGIKCEMKPNCDLVLVVSIHGSIFAQVHPTQQTAPELIKEPRQSRGRWGEISTSNPALEKQPGHWAGRTVRVGFEEDCMRASNMGTKEASFCL